MTEDIETFDGRGQGLSWAQLREALSGKIRTVCNDLAQNGPITARDLQTVLLLHLPRFTAQQLMDESTVAYEAERLLNLMVVKRSGYFDWSNQNKISEFLRGDLRFGLCEDSTAQTIYERFHYIGECRRGVAHLALYHRTVPGIPMALMTISEMDIEHLKHLFEDQPNKALVISRSYAFDWAPRNSISFLTSRLRHWIRQRLQEAAVLFTYVNPNLGFTGSSYAAAGWRVIGPKTIKYRYYHDQYVTYRSMQQLPPAEREIIKTSSLELSPLNLLALSIEGDNQQISTLKIDG